MSYSEKVGERVFRPRASLGNLEPMEPLCAAQAWPQPSPSPTAGLGRDAERGTCSKNLGPHLETAHGSGPGSLAGSVRPERPR